ncbi:unnamed protein product, partial [Urochloa humidicola]
RNVKFTSDRTEAKCRSTRPHAPFLDSGTHSHFLSLFPSTHLSRSSESRSPSLSSPRSTGEEIRIGHPRPAVSARERLHALPSSGEGRCVAGDPRGGGLRRAPTTAEWGRRALAISTRGRSAWRRAKASFHHGGAGEGPSDLSPHQIHAAAGVDEVLQHR